MAKEMRLMCELRALIEAELRKYPEFDAVAPMAPYLHEPDGDGANWDSPYWSGPEPLAAEAKQRLAPAVRKLRKKYLGKQDL